MLTITHQTATQLNRAYQSAFYSTFSSSGAMWISFLSLLACLLFAPVAYGVCPGDVNSDGNVDSLDLSIVSDQFSSTQCSAPEDCSADLDGDNDVDGSDVWLLIQEFGSTGCVPQTEVSGIISVDTTWNRAGSPYIVTGIVTVQGTDGEDDITTLTIEPGVEVRLDYWGQIVIGDNSGDLGALVAQGTAENQILFTTTNNIPYPGNWRNITFSNTSDDATSKLEHCVIKYAGGIYGGVYLYMSSPTIQYNTFHYCKNAGIYAAGPGTGNAKINCNTFVSNDKGIYWDDSSPPEMHSNNFSGNTGFGLDYDGAEILNAEDNWWNTDQGPNTVGDTFSGNVDADPWSTAKNICSESAQNQPPNLPSAPMPVDGAVRVFPVNDIHLIWSGSDPNYSDLVRYDLYLGTSAQSLSLEAADLIRNIHTINSAQPGSTHYWQVIAKDDKGAQTPGPVWRFTTVGGTPDLIVSDLTTDPGGNIQIGDPVTLQATIQNTGSGPAVDIFEVDFIVGGASIGPATVDSVLLAGESITVSRPWTYAGGNPTIGINADSLGRIYETDWQNNTLSLLFSDVVDNTPPVLVSTSPADGAHLQQMQQITATLADSQGAVDAANVISSFSVVDGSVSPISGAVSGSNDTFTFVPETLPLDDSIYTVTLNCVDNHGNSQDVQFSFSIDNSPPGKPIITGGTVASGALQVRPAQNSSDQFGVTVTGNRDSDTSVWINEKEIAAGGDDGWSATIVLQPGANSIEIWLVDLAGNRGVSEWVDVDVLTANRMIYEYDATGRLRRIDQSN